jgi:hypothetical protein
LKEDILHKDITIEVKADGGKLVTLQISKGSFDWMPKGGKKPCTLTWKQFAKLMSDHFS